MRPLDEIIVKDLDVPCGFWSFAVRAYPFQIPETIAVGNRRMQRARANVLNGRRWGFTRDLFPVNVVERHALSRCPRDAARPCALPPSSLLRGGTAPRQTELRRGPSCRIA